MPPPGAAVGSANLGAARWIRHRVISGERLSEIAERYRVEIANILEWNELDTGNPMLRAGQKLRIWTSEAPAERKRKSYLIRESDTWPKIANRYGVPLSRLRNQWNPGVEELLPGERIVVFVEVEPSDAEAAEIEAPPPPGAIASSAPAKPSASANPLAAVVEVPPQPPARSTSRASARAGTPVEPPPSAKAPAPEAAKPTVAAAPQPRTETRASSPTAASRSAMKEPTAPQPSGKSVAVAPPVSVKAPGGTVPQPKVSPFDTTKTPPSGPTLAAVLRPRTSANAKLRPMVKTPSLPTPRLPIVPVAPGAHSAGAPARGRLLRGVQLPSNDALYSIRNPDNSWGSTHALEQLQRAVARFREDSGYDRELLICDMSRQHGGRFRPHSSHRSGRDVDIQLPVKRGLPSSTIPREIGQVDWDAAWALVSALVSTGQVKYIFLSRSRQRPLYEAALRAGERKESLRDFIQFPEQSRTALLRHSQGHVKHLHVRFKCAPYETQCIE